MLRQGGCDVRVAAHSARGRDCHPRPPSSCSTRRPVYVEQVDVPLQLWSSGFNSHVMQEELANAMLDIEREGRAREATRELALEAGDDSIDLVTEYFELTPLVRAFQQSGGFVAYVVDWARHGRWRQLCARARHHGPRRVGAQRYRNPSAGRRPGLRPQGCRGDHAGRGARAPVRVLPGPGLDGVGRYQGRGKLYREALPTASRTTQVWLLNLPAWSSTSRAIRRLRWTGSARRCASTRPSRRRWSMSVCCWTQIGKPAEAVKAFELLFADLDDGVSDRTYAAAYAEWGKN